MSGPHALPAHVGWRAIGQTVAHVDRHMDCCPALGPGRAVSVEVVLSERVAARVGVLLDVVSGSGWLAGWWVGGLFWGGICSGGCLHGG